MTDIQKTSGKAARMLTRRSFLLSASAMSLSAAVTFLGVNRLKQGESHAAASTAEDDELERKFAFLSTHGNSNCSAAFLNSIASMKDEQRLQGSCCSPMVLEKYKEQIGGLKKYANIALIPPDAHDIEAGLAKKLLDFGKTITPMSSEQAILDKGVADSDEKGYCCCMCWRWYTYEGLSRYLVRNEHFNAQQITDVLDNSGGCGGGEH